MSDKLILGNLEACELPELGICDLHVRVDTGARTSSLHVDNIKRFKRGGRSWVRFDIHPNAHNVEEVTRAEAPLHAVRRVKSSNGQTERRRVIQTEFRIGEHSWPIEISLTDRSDMSYLMLLGREAMGDRVLIDPSATFLASEDVEAD
ncbi:MAG: ATP-dependent zinc protease [Gammaproteobacteria bacterium]|nr:ATP-dependent zinc protease [Gammaproteobacteria bacterium]